MDQLLPVCVILMIHFCGGEDHFGYGEEDGPDTWTGTCKTGKSQSPVDIQLSDADVELYTRVHFVFYGTQGNVILHNNGHTVMLSGFQDWGRTAPYMYSGGLHVYDLVQVHFHWSQDDCTGSEHTVGGLHYPGEIHFVHVKRGRSLDDGKPYDYDTIAVLGVFFNIGSNSEPFAFMEEPLSQVVQSGATTDISSMRVMDLLPQNQRAFYRYNGSLTTPTCDEAVVWTVFAEPISISPSQMALLRNIRFPNGKVGENFRPTMPLNGRRITFRPSV